MVPFFAGPWPGNLQWRHPGCPLPPGPLQVCSLLPLIAHIQLSPRSAANLFSIATDCTHTAFPQVRYDFVHYCSCLLTFATRMGYHLLSCADPSSLAGPALWLEWTCMVHMAHRLALPMRTWLDDLLACALQQISVLLR